MLMRMHNKHTFAYLCPTPHPSRTYLCPPTTNPTNPLTQLYPPHPPHHPPHLILHPPVREVRIVVPHEMGLEQKQPAPTERGLLVISDVSQCCV